MQLTDKQWAQLKVHEDRNYVDSIRGHIVRDYLVLADDSTLRERLNAAYAHTKTLGFTHDVPLVDFLYMEASHPDFYKMPVVAAWLNKPGLPAEQRFEMLLQVTRKKQQQMMEKH